VIARKRACEKSAFFGSYRLDQEPPIGGRKEKTATWW